MAFLSSRVWSMMGVCQFGSVSRIYIRRSPDGDRHIALRMVMGSELSKMCLSKDKNPIGRTRQELNFVANVWPMDFEVLYEIGKKVFERFFKHKPDLEKCFGTEGDWRTDEKIKRVLLALMQTLSDSVWTFAGGDQKEIKSFTESILELGGYHRAAIAIPVEAFDLLFNLLPEVIADVSSQNRPQGPFTVPERTCVIETWTSLCKFTCSTLTRGWHKAVIPTHSKYAEIYRSWLARTGLKPGPYGRAPQEAKQTAIWKAPKKGNGPPTLGIGRTKEELEYVSNLWPTHYGVLYDISKKTFDLFFQQKPELEKLFGVEGDWRTDESIKRVLLALMACLSDGIYIFAGGDPDEIKSFSDGILELGGYHRAAIPVPAECFEIVFKLLPEIIADMISSSRQEGSLSVPERTCVITTWTSICNYIHTIMMRGWQRSVIPKNSRYATAYQNWLARKNPPKAIEAEKTSTTSTKGLYSETKSNSSESSKTVEVPMYRAFDKSKPRRLVFHE